MTNYIKIANIKRALRELTRPEFVFNPVQFLHGIKNEFSSTRYNTLEIMLPWGLPISVRPSDAIGRNILRFGIYDLVVSEVIWRLLDPGELSLDIGANIGHMTSIMAYRVGKSGSVIAFEPHPEIYVELMRNVSRWDLETVGKINVINIALSDADGEWELSLPHEFASNRGTAFLTPASRCGSNEVRSCRVTLGKLDDVIGATQHVGVMKIDVEGHEIQVLRGASRLIDRGGIRDIVFEEHEPAPTVVTKFLIDRGYKVFYLSKTFSGLKLIDIESPFKVQPHEAPNYLATKNIERALARLKESGWQILK